MAEQMNEEKSPFGLFSFKILALRRKTEMALGLKTADWGEHAMLGTRLHTLAHHHHHHQKVPQSNRRKAL